MTMTSRIEASFVEGRCSTMKPDQCFYPLHVPRDSIACTYDTTAIRTKNYKQTFYSSLLNAFFTSLTVEFTKFILIFTIF